MNKKFKRITPDGAQAAPKLVEEVETAGETPAVVASQADAGDQFKPYLEPGDEAFFVSWDYSTFRGAAVVESIDYADGWIWFNVPLATAIEKDDMILNFNDFTRWANTYAAEDTGISRYRHLKQAGFRKVGR